MTQLPDGEEWRAMDAASNPYRRDDALVAAAKARIESDRKLDVVVRLLDGRGKPLPGVAVDVVQTTNAFPFGDHLWKMDRLHRFGQFDTDEARYRKHLFEQLFNSCNALCYWTERGRNDGPKTEDFQGDPQMTHFAACVDWGLASGLAVKGHPLFWSIPKCVPEWVKRYDPPTMMKFAEVRVRNLVARFKGKVMIWDAVNEPMWEAAFANLSRRDWPHLESIDAIADYVSPVLRWCREEDPEAVLVVNDYGMEADPEAGAPVARDGTRVTAALQRRRFLSLLTELTRRGTPPDAVGLQSHTGGWIDHATQIRVYEEMASAGYPVHVTEFWAEDKHLEAAGVPLEERRHRVAEYVTDYVTVAYSHPSVEAFFFWGVLDAAVSWGKWSTHEPTVIYETLRRTLNETFKTRVSATSGGDGAVRFRGFPGEYVVRVALKGGGHKGVRCRVSKGPGATVDAVLVGNVALNIG